jgi:GT2 family glycosyltransferase
MNVHIGITTKNRCTILPKAIQSAMGQTFPGKVISVFDDASTDGTQALKDQFPQVNWIFSPESKGYIYARNLFLERKDCEFFCSLDDDSWFLNERALEIAIDYIKKDKKIAAIAFDIVDPDKPEMKNKTIEPVETNWYIGCGHLLNVEVVRKVGAYIPTPGLYSGEEKDLCIRLMDAGYKILLLKGLYVWHDKSMVGRNAAYQHRSIVCNDLIFAFRRAPFILVFPSIISKLWKHFAFSWKYYEKYKEYPLFTSYWKGVRDFLKYLFSGKTNRKAVSVRTFKRYMELN